MSGHPGDPDSPTSEFDEEQDIEAFEQDGVDMEEVRGHDARRLRAQELTPEGTTASGSRAEPVVLHDLGDGARRQAHTELAQLTLDAPVAPPLILLRQANDEGRRVVVDGRATL